MGSILNGMAVFGGLIPYGATFLVFADYMRAAVRLAALSYYPSIFIFTHDSVGLGEDGPTHQPVEHLAACRAIPNLLVMRPADGAETAEAYRVALAVNSREELPADPKVTTRDSEKGPWSVSAEIMSPVWPRGRYSISGV